MTRAETNLTLTGFDPAQPIVGQPVSVSVAVSVLSPGAGVPGGTVQLSSGGESCSFTLASGAGSCVLTPAAPGQFELAAEYSGDSNFNASSGSFAGPQVAKAASATTLTSSDLASVYGQPVTFTAVADAAAPGYGAPTGSIQFFLNGAALGSPVALEHGAAESAPVSNLAPGTYRITAEYSGDGIFNPSAAPAINQAVAKTE